MTINQEALEKYGVRRYDAARYLKTEEDIADYLTEALANGDMDALLKALNNVTRARGMSQVAEASGVRRESLYKALSEGAKPRFDTINKVLNALGVCLRAEPAKPKVTRTGVATYTHSGRGPSRPREPKPIKVELCSKPNLPIWPCPTRRAPAYHRQRLISARTLPSGCNTCPVV